MEPINLRTPSTVFSSILGGLCGIPGQNAQHGQRWHSSSSSSTSSSGIPSLWETRGSSWMFRSMTVSASSIPLSRPLDGGKIWGRNKGTWWLDYLRQFLHAFRQLQSWLLTLRSDFEWLMCSASGSRKIKVKHPQQLWNVQYDAGWLI